MTKVKLKPCPFCGEIPKLKNNKVCQNWDDKGGHWWDMRTLPEQWIECTNINCFVLPSLSRVNIKDAAEIWNNQII